ncbi:nadh:ubiquinone oxidoreductase 24 kd subunit [Leptolyngbya sp. Heron Island J]|uniref:(2Fe-2S) ferredoxin domain-containing protein n=1 Tax=Leptolyngbya sp. Heron Island J TaxID=1385935 RepID=UPI0003B9D495|nr:(2Fe-2S) ferredoxin domain-containing protein [Leptolyngbya sp. Heron Island J]ESA32721.1 nadh:ubiquinone oxidoreductase 24 kd subunit [Leptolyngbya sp. Heron Island J]
MAKAKQTFCLEGRFEGFMAGGKSPFKYLSLRSTSDEQHVIKLPKSVRLMLFRYLQTGDWVRVVGEESIDKETGEPKLKAQEVVRVKPLEVVTTPPQSVSSQAKRKPPKILICQKSTCRKRGAAQVCREVEATLASCGLTDAVEVKLTGCMDKCKAGPNMVVMPDKQRYTKVKPGQVSELIAQHFQADDVG